MLCERCQTREANIVLTEIMNGKKRQIHLCGQCASESEFGKLAEEFPFIRLLSGILGHKETPEEDEAEGIGQITCPGCKMTYGEFVKGSQFGCADCYNTFGPLIEGNLRKLQVGSIHTGKRPKYQQAGVAFEKSTETVQQKESKEEQLKLLQARLQEALEEENYEQAAAYRDEIYALKEQIKQESESRRVNTEE